MPNVNKEEKESIHNSQTRLWWVPLPQHSGWPLTVTIHGWISRWWRAQGHSTGIHPVCQSSPWILLLQAGDTQQLVSPGLLHLGNEIEIRCISGSKWQNHPEIANRPGTEKQTFGRMRQANGFRKSPCFWVGIPTPGNSSPQLSTLLLCLLIKNLWRTRNSSQTRTGKCWNHQRFHGLRKMFPTELHPDVQPFARRRWRRLSEATGKIPTGSKWLCPPQNVAPFLVVIRCILL